MRFILLLLFTLLMVTLLIFINTNSFGLVDNTKKRIMITTVTLLDCYKNETQCKVAQVWVNRTDMGNLSIPMKGVTNL